MVEFRHGYLGKYVRTCTIVVSAAGLALDQVLKVRMASIDPMVGQPLRGGTCFSRSSQQASSRDAGKERGLAPHGSGTAAVYCKTAADDKRHT